MFFFFEDENRNDKFSDDRVFTRAQVDNLLNASRGKTLGEVDKAGIIEGYMKANPNKVGRGVAGDIIEVSVLGCKRDSRPEPDILVDNIRTELKTTGVRRPKKKSDVEYEAKEPLTITGVSPHNIIHEQFGTSRFYHKLEHLLFVFYHYILQDTAISSEDYAAFPILGHLFWEVPPEDLETLRNDWGLVKEFASSFSFDNKEEREKLKNNLMLIDYASHQQPRFRLKRSYVSSIVETFLKQEKLASLPKHISKFADIDAKCHQFTQQYKGKTVSEISETLGVEVNSKDACQRIIVKMFGGEARTINQIKDFKDIGLIAKTVVLSSSGGRTEDMKMCEVDFDEFLRPNISFSEVVDLDNDGNDIVREYSNLYSYFAEHPFIFIVFREPYKPAPNKTVPLEQCEFVGFKRYSFAEDFIFTEVHRSWIEARDLIFSRSLKLVKSGGGYAPNFPKSKDHIVFYRGSGSDGTDKKKLLRPWGIDFYLYTQWVWIKGKYIVSELEKVKYL